MEAHTSLLAAAIDLPLLLPPWFAEMQVLGPPGPAGPSWETGWVATQGCGHAGKGTWTELRTHCTCLVELPVVLYAVVRAIRKRFTALPRAQLLKS